MFVKFVYWTGALDFLIGLATWGGTLANPQPGQFVALMTLGMFLCMAAACLMWASRDVVSRYPVIFWQGLVRLTAISAVLYAVPNGLSQPWEYSLVLFPFSRVCAAGQLMRPLAKAASCRAIGLLIRELCARRDTGHFLAGQILLVAAGELN